MSWNTVCQLDDIIPNTGVAALVNDTQIAIFSVDDQLYAIANKDPFSEANVLARGIVCSVGEQLTVASPIYKQHFSLADGSCLEDSDVSVASYPVRTEGQQVQIEL